MREERESKRACMCERESVCLRKREGGLKLFFLKKDHPNPAFITYFLH